MKRSWIRISFEISLGLALLFFWLNPALSFDNVKPDESVIATNYDADFSYPIVTAIGKAYGLARNMATGKYYFQEGIWQQQGSGVIVAPGYVLTAAHIIRPRAVQVAEGRMIARQSDVVCMTSREVWIEDTGRDPIPTRVLYEDETSDLAIITYDFNKHPWLKPISYDIEYTDWDELKNGDIICAVLHERSTEDCSHGQLTGSVKLRWGTVMSQYPVSPHDWLTSMCHRWHFTATLPIYGGDSGSPIFAFRNGRPILIGIAQAYYLADALFYTFIGRLTVVHKIISIRQ